MGCIWIDGEEVKRGDLEESYIPFVFEVQGKIYCRYLVDIRVWRLPPRVIFDCNEDDGRKTGYFWFSGIEEERFASSEYWEKRLC
jgi:hypothetical protein